MINPVSDLTKRFSCILCNSLERTREEGVGRPDGGVWTPPAHPEPNRGPVQVAPNDECRNSASHLPRAAVLRAVSWGYRHNIISVQLIISKRVRSQWPFGPTARLWSGVVAPSCQRWERQRWETVQHAAAGCCTERHSTR